MSWADQPARMARVASEQRALLSVIGKETTMTDYKEQRISVTNGQDVHFKGRLLGAYSTQNKDSTKTRWTELRLWLTERSHWVAESVGRSTERGHVDLVDVRVIEIPGELVETVEVEPGKFADVYAPDLNAAQLAVMDAWGWTTAAKAFARTQGWDVTRKVP